MTKYPKKSGEFYVVGKTFLSPFSFHASVLSFFVPFQPFVAFLGLFLNPPPLCFFSRILFPQLIPAYTHTHAWYQFAVLSLTLANALNDPVTNGKKSF